MPSPNPLEHLKESKAKSDKLKGLKKHVGDAKKILDQLTKAQTAGKTAKKELEAESDAD